MSMSRPPAPPSGPRPARPWPASAWAAVVLLAGCAAPQQVLPPDASAVARPYRQAIAAPAPHAAAGALPVLDAATWQGFGDPLLVQLVARSRSANLDVRQALERVQQARAGAVAVASRQGPTLALTGSLSDQRTALPEAVKRGAPDTRAGRLALDLSWEIDLAGAARAAADGAAMDALAADEAVEVAQWLASTEVARQYLLWQGARLRLRQLQALLEAQQATERIVRRREAEGQASRFDVERAAGESRALAAQLPPLAAQVAVIEHQVALLLGRPPGATLLPDAPDPPAALPDAPVLAPGQPAALLARRPDLRVAARQLQAEAARLREREADLWPKFFLAAVLGGQDLRLNGLDLSPARFSQVALAFTAPLFNADRLRAAVQRQSARVREATLGYERAVLGALVDVENSLAAAARERERAEALAATLGHRRTGLRHAESLHREGQVDLLQLLDAQRALIAAELALTESRTAQALAAVQLVKALGGGWMNPSSPAIPVAATDPAAPASR